MIKSFVIKVENYINEECNFVRKIYKVDEFNANNVFVSMNYLYILLQHQLM